MTVHRGVAAIYIVAWISPIEVRHSMDIPAEPRRLSGSAGFPVRIPNGTRLDSIPLIVAPQRPWFTRRYVCHAHWLV